MSQNYIISYDLNGPTPSHKQMDDHLRKGSEVYGRILETVWYARSSGTPKEVFDYVNLILSVNDRLIVVAASDAWFRNLLISNPSLQENWRLAA